MTASVFLFVWMMILVNSDFQLPTTSECQYVAWTDVSNTGNVLGRLSYGRSINDECYIKYRKHNYSYSERHECNSDNNTWIEYYYDNLFCDGEAINLNEINDDEIWDNKENNYSTVWSVNCDNNVIDCASYAYIYDVDSCDDYGIVPLHDQLSNSSIIHTWTYQFGIYSFCGKFYKGPYAPSLDEDGAYFTLHSCENGEIKTKQWSAEKDGVFEENQCGDHNDHIGFIEFDFIDGRCITKNQFLNSKLGEIVIDFNLGPIEKQYVQIHVHCPNYIESKDEDKKTNTNMVIACIIIIAVLIILMVILLILYTKCKNKQTKPYHNRVNTTDQTEVDDLEKEQNDQNDRVELVQ